MSTRVYEPRGAYDPRFAYGCCAASVYWEERGGGWRQCSRRPQKGTDWCGTHAPGAQEARDKAASDRYHATVAFRKDRRVLRGLREATDEQLRAEIARREAVQP